MKKRSRIKLSLLILALLLMFVGCGGQQAETTETESATPIDPQDKTWLGSYQNMTYSYLTAVDVSVLTTQLNSAYLLLANKQNALDSGYVPSELVKLNCPVYQSNREYLLQARAANALYEMLEEMQAAGVSNVMVASAYRSYSYQVSTYNNHVEKERRAISEEAIACFGYEYIKTNYLDRQIYQLTLEDAHTVAQTYSAQPGKSEHQTGLCVDLVTSEESEALTVAFEQTQAFAWLAENAYRFGFILRYPKGDEAITGYTYEPWHYRFVGREAATDMHLGDLTLEEYLALCNA